MTVYFRINGKEHTHRVGTNNANFAREETEIAFPGAIVWLILR